jgi:diacylglycerol kinase family enzyme
VAETGEARTDRYAAVVYNPIKKDLDKLRVSVDAAAAAAGWAESHWFPTSADDGGRHATRLALRSGASLVVAAGGDGTVRAVAQAMLDSDVSLAIVPMGTGNLLARNLQLPLGSIDDSATVAFGGDDRAIDVGLATVTDVNGKTSEHVFLVMAGLGIDAEMLANTRADLKKQVGWLAYVDAGVRVIPRSEQFRIRYSLGGRSDRHAHISTILIANCGLLPANVQFLPDARVDDGILDIAVLQPRGMLDWLKIWRRVTWDNGVLRRSSVGRRIIRLTEVDNERMMTTFRSRDVRIVVEKPQEFELDGDEFGKVRSVFLRTDQRSLLVRVPASSAVGPVG